MVKHLPKILKNDDSTRCNCCPWFNCCNDNWQKVMNFHSWNSWLYIYFFVFFNFICAVICYYNECFHLKFCLIIENLGTWIKIWWYGTSVALLSVSFLSLWLLLLLLCCCCYFPFVVQVWAVLKPGFLALLGDPLDTKPIDIIVFDVLPSSDGNGDGRVSLATEIKDRNPLRHTFKVNSTQVVYIMEFILF